MDTNNIKAIIFDLDGTLLDTLTDLKNSLNEALRNHGLPERTTDEVRRFVGNGIAKLVVAAYNGVVVLEIGFVARHGLVGRAYELVGDSSECRNNDDDVLVLRFYNTLDIAYAFDGAYA